MPDYVYHLDDGSLSNFDKSFESRIGDNSGYHEQEHLETLHMLLSLNRAGSCLDVGAGTGRITAIAREIIADLVALEPDQSRWQVCHDAFHREPGCLVLNQTTEDYIHDNPGRKFDLIIVSMVLQHLSTTNSRKLMNEVAVLLKDSGAAIIYTTHTLEKCKGFSFTGDNSRAYVPESDFNAYTDSPPSDQKLGLPVRRFSKTDLMEIVEAAGLDPVYWRQTSYYVPNRIAFFANRLGVDEDELRYTGNSQFVVVQRKSQRSL